MLNRISKAYQALDDTLMSSATALTKAYNWTTGDTKAGLANKLLTASPILMSTGTYITTHSMLGTIGLGGLYLGVSHFIQKENTRIEKLEQQALEDQAINSEVVSHKEVASKEGPAYLAGSGFFANMASSGIYPPQNYEFASGTALMGSSCALNSASCYVMRTESLPPKKDCITRGIESLVQTYKENKAAKSMVPLLARSKRSLFS